MENYNDEIFGFGNETNEEIEQTNSFNYDSISGLGESDYENEDLFSTEVEPTDSSEDNFTTNFRIGDFNNEVAYNDEEELVTNIEEFKIDEPEVFVENETEEPSTENYIVDESFFEPIQENVSDVETVEEEPEVEEVAIVEEEPAVEEEPVVEEVPVEEKVNVTMSETPIEELNKLTEFEEEKIEETDINALFDKVSVNVKDASDIFRKNTDLKQKIDTRFEELKKLQSEIENSRKKQIDEINEYKEEVLNKLTEKKEEIEKRLNLLKESQATLEKEKQEFEQYKKKEQDKIDSVQKEVQSAYDDRREELSHIEDVLRKQKDALDEERSQLSLDRIQYESDKNELANNLLKFNELVNSFTSGVSDIRE